MKDAQAAVLTLAKKRGGGAPRVATNPEVRERGGAHLSRPGDSFFAQVDVASKGRMSPNRISGLHGRTKSYNVVRVYQGDSQIQHCPPLATCWAYSSLVLFLFCV